MSRIVIGAAIEVHRLMGPGLLESLCEKCLIRERELRGMAVRNQDMVQIAYKDITFTKVWEAAMKRARFSNNRQPPG